MSFFKRLFGGVQDENDFANKQNLYDTPYAQQINQHFEENFPGRTPLVWEDRDGMQIHLLAPTPEEPYYVAYTVGMSANLMEMDNMAHNRQYGYLRSAELMMYLPADWPMAGMLARAAEEEPPRAVCWPLRMLYRLACMPEKCHTWLGDGHSIPNGDPPKALADNTKFCGAVLYLPADQNGPKVVQPVPVRTSKKVMLYVVVPVYEDEMDMKLKKGARWLEDDLRALPDHAGFIVNIDRPSVAEPDEEEE